MFDLTAYEAASVYLALNLILLFIVGFRVIQTRQKHSVGLGDGGNEDVLRAMRVHANFAEYAPLPLLGLFALGLMHAPVLLIHVFGAVFTAARYAHCFGFTVPGDKRPPGRFFGTIGTGVVILFEAIALLYFAFIG